MLLPVLFSDVHDRNFYRWKASEQNGLDRPSKLPLLALTISADILRGVSKVAPLTVKLCFRIITEQLRSMDIEYHVSATRIREFLKSIDMPYIGQNGPKHPNFDAA